MQCDARHMFAQMKKYIAEFLFLLLYYLVGVIRYLRGGQVSPQNPSRILVVSWHLIGDSFMALPAIVFLKRTFPESYLAVLCKPEVEKLYQRVDELDGVMSVRQEDFLKPWHIWALLQGRFDLVVDVTNSPYSVLATMLSGAKYRIGGTGIYRIVGRVYTGFPLAYDRICGLPTGVYAGEYMVNILRQLDIEIKIDSKWRFDHNTLDEIPMAHARLVVRGGPKIGFAIGASRKENLWLNERWAELATELMGRYRATVFLFGGTSDIGDAKVIMELCPAAIKSYVGELPLVESIRIIRDMDFFITNDTGLMHVALHYGIPTVALIGPSEHSNYISAWSENVAVVFKPLFCSPCYRWLELANWSVFPDCKKGAALCKRLIGIKDISHRFNELYSKQGR